jgi:hypothetical protein
MGNGTSAHGVAGGKGIDNTELLLRHLGGKYPFSDSELRTLLMCFQHQKQQSLETGGGKSHHRPFLIDLVLGCYSPLEDKERISETLHTLKFIEGHILSAGFGSALREASFPNDAATQWDDHDSHMETSTDSRLRRQTKHPLHSQANANAVTAPHADQSESRVDFVLNGLSRMCGSPTTVFDEDETFSSSGAASLENLDLHQFLDGMTKLFGRSGSRWSLELIFLVCCHSHNNNSSSSSGTNAANGTTHNKKQAKAQDLVYLAYQLGLSALLLSSLKCNHRRKGDAEDDDSDSLFTSTTSPFNPIALTPSSSLGRSEDPTTFLTSGDGRGDPALVSLGRSLFRAECQAQHESIPPPPPPPPDSATNHAGSDADDNNDWVSLQTFVSWAESVAPLLSATLPTLMHHIVFQKHPFSPSRKPFLFPDIKGKNSSFFSNKFSPRLFSLACMSSSLGGSVSLTNVVRLKLNNGAPLETLLSLHLFMFIVGLFCLFCL